MSRVLALLVIVAAVVRSSEQVRLFTRDTFSPGFTRSTTTEQYVPSDEPEAEAEAEGETPTRPTSEAATLTVAAVRVLRRMTLLAAGLAGGNTQAILER
ncbi:hypothetical protein [Streptomyces capillispiralis]|uniref:hypothetical protein n=1 Tax=Streptomyces capillispiralis TaxID=68182 RepID=UPI0011A82B37|nr:hypothetical protein [Streptomyces capillispiralis]GHH94075.1 hypothetical protein GCM10017779_45320 [Streptomyces capillispiralis]